MAEQTAAGEATSSGGALHFDIGTPAAMDIPVPWTPEPTRSARSPVEQGGGPAKKGRETAKELKRELEEQGEAEEDGQAKKTRSEVCAVAFG